MKNIDKITKVSPKKAVSSNKKETSKKVTTSRKAKALTEAELLLDNKAKAKQAEAEQQDGLAQGEELEPEYLEGEVLAGEPDDSIDPDDLIDPDDPIDSIDASDAIELDLEAGFADGFEAASFLGPAVAAPPERLVKDGLTLYLREISKFPMLKPEEEIMLAQRVKQFGDSDAAFRLVSSHLRLVVRIAMDFQRRWMQNVLDLIQEGNVGLLRAANKFDSDKGIKFSYYAAFWIKAYILKFIMDNWRMVKIGTTQTQRKLFYNLNKERQKLIAQGFDPDNKTLAANLGVTEENIVEMTQRMDGGDVSLDVPIGDESHATRMEFLPALGPGTEESLASNQLAGLLREQLEKILPRLSDKEKDILQNRLLSDEPTTLREIGAKYNITRERVRQIETRLLQKLHAHLSKEIEDFSEDWIRQ